MIFTRESITGTSTSTPTTVASAAPDSIPNRIKATATPVKATATPVQRNYGADKGRRYSFPVGNFQVFAPEYPIPKIR